MLSLLQRLFSSSTRVFRFLSLPMVGKSTNFTSAPALNSGFAAESPTVAAASDAASSTPLRTMPHAIFNPAFTAAVGILARALAVSLLYLGYKMFHWVEPALAEAVRSAFGVQPAPSAFESGAASVQKLVAMIKEAFGGVFGFAESLNASSSFVDSTAASEGGAAAANGAAANGAANGAAAAAATAATAAATTAAAVAEAERLAAALAETTSDLEQLRRSGEGSANTGGFVDRLLPFVLGALLGAGMGLFGFGDTSNHDAAGHLAALAQQSNANREAIVDAVAMTGGAVAASSLEQHRQLLEGLSLTLEQNAQQTSALQQLLEAVGASRTETGAAFAENGAGVFTEGFPLAGNALVLANGGAATIDAIGAATATTAAATAAVGAIAAVGVAATAAAGAVSAAGSSAMDPILAQRTGAFLKGAAAVTAADGSELLRQSQCFIAERYGSALEQHSAKLREAVVERARERWSSGSVDSRDSAGSVGSFGSSSDPFNAPLSPENFRRPTNAPWRLLAANFSNPLAPLAGALALPIALAAVRSVGAVLLLRSFSAPDGGVFSTATASVQRALPAPQAAAPSRRDSRLSSNGVEQLSEDLREFADAFSAGAHAAVELLSHWFGLM